MSRHDAMKSLLVFLIVCLSVVANGDHPPNGKYPYHVAIRGKGQKEPMCDGTIVGQHWIVTAASCFYGGVQGKLEQRVKEDDVEVIVGGVANLLKSKVVKALTYSVSRIIVHPDYNPGPDYPINTDNVLLIEVDENLLKPVGDIKPQAAKLAKESQDSEFSYGTEATVYRGYRGRRTKLYHRKAGFSETSAVCNSETSPGFADDDTMYCLYNDAGCMSMLGAPLISKGRKLNLSRSYTLTGIGAGCPGVVDIYTKISGVSKWIKEQMHKN